MTAVRSFPGTWDAAAQAESWTSAQAARLSLGPEAVYALSLCLEELFLNAVRHGGANEIRLALSGEGLEFRDDGAAFDPTLAAPKRLCGRLDFEIGGFGVGLLQRFSGAIRYAREDGWNVVTVSLPPEIDERRSLRRVGGLGGLDDGRLEKLIAASARLDFAAGDVLMRQGETSDFADVLLRGEAEIYAESRGGPIHIAMARAPAMVGELGAFAGLPRTASVRASRDASVLRIPKAALVEAALAAPAMLIDALGRLGDGLSRVNRAIGLYTHALAALERGEFTADLMHELRDPVPDLADFGETFARIADEIVARRQRNDEMASAAMIQRALLPDPQAFAAATGLDVHAAMTPARDVGGDFFELIALSDGRVALGVGDVCGKGVPAALSMGVAKTLIRSALREKPDLPAAIRKANAYLVAQEPADQFVTLCYAAFDPRDGALEYVSCGHPAARIRRCDGRIEALAAGGLPVGMFDTHRVVPHQARLDPGDLVLIHSDGVTEAGAGSQTEFGVARLDAALSRAPARAGAAVEAVMAAATAFSGSAPAFDDVTCVALARAK